ncbi:acyl-CoA-binding domain-containing protein 6 isoform X2 [Macaca thibetana thibetana]|uniref:acyl-CoA-binding domain-containing protein 6 isoform X2 n=1 Tax=Macaca thibetana thibetana TaxID=257877 RepID=UPI0021BCBF14|nr:acyl-CoA-binding domain-containing protein 6 isoform X2 [Macaca thibetana thibetana]
MASSFLPAGATTGDSGGELSSGDDSGEVEFPHSPEIEESSCLAELFEKAAAHLQGLIQVASREQLLYLYARYKQIPEKKGKEANTGFGGPVISSLYHEETIREEDKNIFDYCRENNIDHITKAIKSKNVDVNVKDEEGRALLHWACDRGHKELVTVLLQHRADINCQDNEGQTALHYASACEFLDIVELLLQSGADPTLRDQDGCLPEEVTGCKTVSLVLQRHTTGKA